jgi:hypothetical protein
MKKLYIIGHKLICLKTFLGIKYATISAFPKILKEAAAENSVNYADNSYITLNTVDIAR